MDNLYNPIDAAIVLIHAFEYCSDSYTQGRKIRCRINPELTARVNQVSELIDWYCDGMLFLEKFICENLITHTKEN